VLGNPAHAMAVQPSHTPMLTAAIDRPLGLAQNEATSAEDVALVAAIRRGDPGSREALYHRYKRRVFALAVRIVGAADAEEVSQEAFIRIFRGLPKFRGDAALGTWIYRLSVNAALSHRSRRGPLTAASPTESDAPTPAVLIEQPPSTDAVLRVRLERALWRLPVGYRTVIVLHDVEGLEHEEVAQILGCHVGTSKSQLHKARGKLRELLVADGITATELEGR
jgi:RNA polymerase sigma-70 factor, ECF subfamily